MKLRFFLSPLIFVGVLISCENDKDSEGTTDFQCEATVVGQGMDCGETFMITLTSSIDPDMEEGTYYADHLNSGLKIQLNGRAPNADETYACTTMGPGYPHLVNRMPRSGGRLNGDQ